MHDIHPGADFFRVSIEVVQPSHVEFGVDTREHIRREVLHRSFALTYYVARVRTKD